MVYYDEYGTPLVQNENGSFWQYDNQLPSFDPMNIRPDLRAEEMQKREDFAKPPTNITEARERGYFGVDMKNHPESDDFLRQLFQSKGLNEQQAADAAIKGLQAHEAQFGQGYTTATPISHIFNAFLFPSIGMAGDSRLDGLPGWTVADAESRGGAAAAKEHGGDFGSATGLGQILSYQSNLGGNIAESFKQDPERMLLGINTPAESEIWGKVLGKDYRPTVDMTGGSTAYDTQSAQAKGIDTQSGEAMQQIAKMLAMKFGGGAINGLFGEGGSALTSSAGSTGSSTGSSSLLGDAGSDTLGGEGIDASTGQYPGESAMSGNSGGGMWDYVDDYGFDPGASDYGFDPGSEGIYNAPLAEDTSTGAFDQFGMNNPNTGFQDQGFDPGGDPNSLIQQAQAIAKKYGITPQSALNIVKKLAQVGGGASNKSTGGGILDSITNDPLGAAFNASPFLLAIAEANKQSGQVDPILARMSGLSDQAAANQNGLLGSVLNPYNRQTMAGRDALMSDQSLRGIRGSSFGDQALTSFDTARDQGLGELRGATTARSIDTQGNVLKNLLAGQTAAATSRNMLIGAGLNASGKLFSPQKDPFDLEKLSVLLNGAAV